MDAMIGNLRDHEVRDRLEEIHEVVAELRDESARPVGTFNISLPANERTSRALLKLFDLAGVQP